MLKSKQKHSGGGDNVLNKTIYQGTSLRHWLSGLALLAVLCGTYLNWSAIKHYMGWDKVFKAYDPRFKILIIPFKALCKDGSKDIGLFIKERLEEINRTDSLNISPYYYVTSISQNFNADSAEYLRIYHHADQIIYGNYEDAACSNAQEDQVCYNWLTDEKWDAGDHQQNIRSNSNYQAVTTQDIRDGKLQGSTDYIIYWLAGLNAFNQIKYAKAIKYWEHIYEELGIQNLEIVNGLADAYYEHGAYQKAKQFGEELLVLATNTKDSAMALNNLGLTLQALGDYKGAKTLLEQAIVFSKQHYGMDHPQAAICYSNLGYILENLGDYNQARVLLERAIAYDEQHARTDYPSMARKYSNLSRVFQKMGDYDQAKILLEKAIILDEDNFGQNHPITMSNYSNLALIFKDLKNYTQAKLLLKKTVVFHEQNFGKDHPITATNYANLGMVLHYSGNFNEAKLFLEKALKVLTQRLGPEHPRTKLTHYNLTVLLEDMAHLPNNPYKKN